MTKFLRYRKTGHIVTLTMNEPDSMNALSGPDQYADFEKYCARINQDYDVRCVILTGAGRAFSAGGNVKAMQERNRKGQPPSVVIRDWYKNGIQRIPMAFYNLEVPTIAAVNGAATGAGCDLTCMADIGLLDLRTICRDLRQDRHFTRRWRCLLSTTRHIKLKRSGDGLHW